MVPRKNRPLIYDTVKNIWMTHDVWHESSFHAYILNVTWNEYARRAVAHYNAMCSNDPENDYTRKRAESFKTFWSKQIKRQPKGSFCKKPDPLKRTKISENK